ncbi:MAG TPA: hypothetical protein VL995_07605 [Cellvibrio sp.]|nr:hypothetical protein [Cellvibrio sp.]
MRYLPLRLLLTLLCASPMYCAAYDGDSDFTLQVKYSPWGIIRADDDDSDDFFNPGRYYSEYELDLERTLGVRAMYEPFYIASNRYTTQVNTSSPDARIETYSIGFGGLNYDAFSYHSGLYLLGAIGIGRAEFDFRDQSMNNWEAFVEANAEIGLRLQEHLLIGAGAEWQHFGEPGESHANYWNFYISTGVTF